VPFAFSYEHEAAVAQPRTTSALPGSAPDAESAVLGMCPPPIRKGIVPMESG
jgi:hypothetical protein